MLGAALLSAVIAAEPPARTAPNSAASPRRAVIHARGSIRVPTKTGKTGWRPYPTAGGGFELPTRLRGLSLSVGAEIGAVESDDRVHGFHILHGHVGVVYDLPLTARALHLMPLLALTNATIRAKENSPLSLAVIGVSENEFGVSAGTMLRLAVRRFLVSIPVAVNHVFSAPHPFVEGVGSLQIGLTF